MKELNLKLEWIHIRDVKLGEEDGIQDGVLTIQKEALLSAIDDPFFGTGEVEVARPGESVRIVPV